MKHITLLASVLLLATACSKVPGEVYFNRGAPESLLDVSSEMVNVELASDASIDELTQWINQDQPTRAEVYCLQGDKVCKQANKVLEKFGIPVLYVAAADNNVALIYERILARDCENRYIDNRINPYDLHHPSFGCSIASNLVQHVSDKQQFVSPALMDYADGYKAVQAVDGARQANSYTPTKIDSDFETSFKSTGGGGGGE